MRSILVALFVDAYNYLLGSEERTHEFLDTQAALASWYALARTQPAAIELRDEIGFFNKLAAEVRKITGHERPGEPGRRAGGASVHVRRARGR